SRHRDEPGADPRYTRWLEKAGLGSDIYVGSAPLRLDSCPDPAALLNAELVMRDADPVFNRAVVHPMREVRRALSYCSIRRTPLPSLEVSKRSPPVSAETTERRGPGPGVSSQARIERPTLRLSLEKPVTLDTTLARERSFRSRPLEEYAIGRAGSSFSSEVITGIKVEGAAISTQAADLPSGETRRDPGTGRTGTAARRRKGVVRCLSDDWTRSFNFPTSPSMRTVICFAAVVSR